jgi:hypothetical protein
VGRVRGNRNIFNCGLIKIYFCYFFFQGLETGKNVTESRTNFNFDEVDLANETVKNQNMNEFDNNNEFLNKSKQILTVNSTTVIYNVPPLSSTQQTTIIHHPSPTSGRYRLLVQYSQRYSVINHCDRRITCLDDLDIHVS